MSRSPLIARTVPALRRAVDSLRKRKATVALVPTMGALHDGHVSLVRLAKRRASRVVVSIFVNPTQFAPTEDFGAYPRTWKADIAKLAAEDVDIVWHPGRRGDVSGGLRDPRSCRRDRPLAGLEDRFRPHFFGGVATVVGKLFTQCRPDVAIFGEKDFQQLRVVTQMAARPRPRREGDRLPHGARARRARDVLAQRLPLGRGAADRHHALPRHEGQRRADPGRRSHREPRWRAARRRSQAAGFALDYFEARHAETLAPVTSRKDGPLRILVAAKLGTTRLIDNIGVCDSLQVDLATSPQPYG